MATGIFALLASVFSPKIQEFICCLFETKIAIAHINHGLESEFSLLMQTLS